MTKPLFWYKIYINNMNYIPQDRNSRSNRSERSMVMQPSNENSILKKRLWIGAIIYALLFLLIIVTANIDAINKWVGSVLLLLRPVIIGLVLAYLCNPFFRFYERKVLTRLRPFSFRRTLALLLTYFTVLLIVVLLIGLILPQLVSSLRTFTENYKALVTSAINQVNNVFLAINGFIERFTGNPTFLELLDESLFYDFFTGTANGAQASDALSMLLNGKFEPITSTLGNAVSIITDAVLGFFISLYLLSSKEKRGAQIMKLRNAIFSDKVNGRISRFLKTADRSFGGFLEGKGLDSLIIGVLTYILITIFGIPYAILIATFIGLTNIIPIIGPFLGAIPTAFIILLSEPSKVIPFLLIVLFVQQLDGNVIGPQILGNNTGVSPLCVIIAITLMTSLWGLTGALLGVPLFATVLELIDLYTVDRLQKKGLPSGIESYYATGIDIDPVKDNSGVTNRLMRKLEMNVLAIQRKLAYYETAELSKKERFYLRLYSFAYRCHILSELSDDVYFQFTTQDALRSALRESDAFMNALEETSSHKAS